MGPLDDLAILIEAWTAAKRNQNLPALARASGVSYPSVRRAAQREGKPELETILNILAIVAEPAQRIAFLQKHFPNFAGAIEPSLHELTPLTELVELDRFTLHDFLVLGLSSTKEGTNREEISKKGGERGLRALETLHSVGAVVKNGDRYVTKARHVRINEPDNVFKALGYICELFDFDRVDSRGSLYRVKTQGLTKEAVLAVYKILYEASEKIYAIMENPSNHGDYVMSTGMVSTFLSFPEGEANL